MAEIYRVSETGVFPFGRGVRDLHWHDEVQFTLVTHGSLTLQVDARQYEMRAGDAAFINSGMIHAVTSLSEGGRYSSLNFPYTLLPFFPGSRMEKEYVLPYVTGSCLPVIILRSGAAVQKPALDILYEINAIWDDHLTAQSECFIATKIVTLWYMLLSHWQEETEYKIHKSVEMLSGELSISEIAGYCGYNQTSNYIAKFKTIMGCTPAQYRKRNAQ